MKNIAVIIGKELRGYFNSIIAYTVMVVFLLVTGYLYVLPLFISKEATIRQLIGTMPVIYLFLIPAITMRLFSEEIKSGTLEILFTQPVNDYEVLFGKYLAALIFLSITIICTLFYPLSLLFLGRPDIGQVISSYIGLILLGGALISVGTLASALTKNQIVSFIMALGICFIFFFLGKMTMLVPPFFGNIIDYIGIDRHYENIARGVLDTRDIIYYLSVAAFFLYSALYVLKNRK